MLLIQVGTLVILATQQRKKSLPFGLGHKNTNIDCSYSRNNKGNTKDP